jgi:demethylmenaquinone methyltransferase/2-methoxy-6-polyprenyl-1,4-benzoquinol methylase
VDPNLVSYYSQRVEVYEDIYAKPERLPDLAALEDLVTSRATSQSVLEIACGTGYWTARVARVAERVVATDASLPALTFARSRLGARPSLVLADAFVPPPFLGRFSLALAGFWWSHVPVQLLSGFLTGLHAALKPSARVVLFDNRFVVGSSTPLSASDALGNTYQQRVLRDGARHSVLKNFPSSQQVIDTVLSSGGCDPSVAELTYFWCVSYRVQRVA